jgi:hypothetical protein
MKPIYVNINVNGRWEKVLISSEELKTITKEAFETNLARVKRAHERGEECKLPIELQCVLAESMIKNLHYYIEQYAIQKAIEL